jgi:heme/copper-type cytochrome/quinol oxidase subunit 2
MRHAAIADRDATGVLAGNNTTCHEGHDMKRRTRRRFVFVLFVSLVSFVVALSAQEPSQNRREFTIVAKDHVFTPDKLEVAQDDLVKITLTSEDVPVSFAIDAYRIIKRVAGRTSITFEFRADQAGTFPFYCNLTTDAACKDMKGVLSVRGK